MGGGKAGSAGLGILTTRIGRRFVLLFLGCALVPLVAFALLALTQVSEKLNQLNERDLHNGAKTAGMGLAARLSQVAADIEMVRGVLGADPAAQAALPLEQTLRERCAGLWLADGGGGRTFFGGSAPQLPARTPSEEAHLATGKPLVRRLGDTDLLVMFADLVTGAAGSPKIVAQLRNDWLWDVDELRSPGAEVAVFDKVRRPLFHSFPKMPEAGPLREAVLRQPASGTFEWQVEGEPHVARFWRVFLLPQYDFDALVVQSRARAIALEVVSGFERWFLLTAACTLLCVLVASLVQIRRTLDPIVSLNEATQRVARGEFGARVVIGSRDEFGELGGAFNHMTGQLAENVRRRELTERELVASRDAALAAARAKVEFVTNVSHELRTPMAEILSATEILTHLDDGDPAARREFTEIACNGAKRLARLVDDVLELDSAAVWKLEPVRIEATIHNALAALPPAVRARVRTEVSGDLPVVLGVGRRLSETWCRLLDNAVKFSGPDDPIELRAFGAGDDVVVEVADHGVGISRLDLGSIFEPFRQVGRDQLTEKAQGTGLGLSLARNAVERHGGRIEVESELGNGSTFRVSLPAHSAAAVAVG